jgi:PTS system nitrogen regulatory IIA component
MLLKDIIKPDSVLCNAHARSKKHCLEILSQLLVRAHPEIASEDVFGGLIERERLGCTSLGRGVAFPHCRADGLDASVGALMKLSEPVEFDASDGDAVDLVFGLIVPTEVKDQDQANIHLISELLADPELRERLRSANTSNELYQALCG